MVFALAGAVKGNHFSPAKHASIPESRHARKKPRYDR
jgi:hypothetical protein